MTQSAADISNAVSLSLLVGGSSMLSAQNVVCVKEDGAWRLEVELSPHSSRIVVSGCC